MPNPNIVEAGKATQFKEGHAPLPGAGRPRKVLIDRMAELIEKDTTGELERVRLWWEDAKHEHPLIRRNARNDLMDRLVGKPSQDVNVTMRDEQDSDMGF